MSGLQEPLLADKKRDNKDEKSITKRQLDPEEAETNNVAHLESMNRDQQDPIFSSDRQYEQVHGLVSTEDGTKRVVPSFKSVARRVILLRKVQSQRSARQFNASKGHRNRMSSAPAGLLDQIAVEESFEENDDSAIFRAAGIEVSSDESDTDEMLEEADDEDDYGQNRDDTLPTVTTQYGSIPAASNPKAVPWTRSAVPFWKKCFPRCDPSFLVIRLRQVLIGSYFLWVAMPLFVLSFIFYYGAGNPEIWFIPGTARSAWLLNFFGRQVVTLELARLTQWLILDCLLLGSRTLAQYFGPIVTMTAVQSRGWPFVVALWGCWDLLILHGDGEFQTHWFYWTGWDLYSIAKSGQYILTSESYFRMLLCMIVAGIVATAKRMLLTVHFGRRTLGKFQFERNGILASKRSEILIYPTHPFLHSRIQTQTGEIAGRHGYRERDCRSSC